MDEDLQNIIERVFNVKDAKEIEKMLDAVNRNISDSQSKKRVTLLDDIVSGADND